jgi:hypothetical protein
MLFYHFSFAITREKCVKSVNLKKAVVTIQLSLNGNVQGGILPPCGIPQTQSAQVRTADIACFV